MARKNIPPPQPPRGGDHSTSSSSGDGEGGTATTAPSSTYYSLSEIDDDSSTAAGASSQINHHHHHHNNNNNNNNYPDDTTEISDNDSILEMAKRLDAASVISDPSFIEGPVSFDGAQQHPSKRYASRMDDIASESEDDDEEEEADSSGSSDDDDGSSGDEDSSSSSDDDSDSSSDDDDDRNNNNHHHHHHRGRYNKHQSKGTRKNKESGRRYNQKNSEEGMRRRSHRNSSGSGGRSERRRREKQHQRNPRQQQQQQSASMPSQPYYDSSYDSRGGQQQQHNNMSSQGGGEQRKYSPPRGGGVSGAAAVDPMMYTTTTTTTTTNNNKISKKQSRGSRDSDPKKRSKQKQHERYHDRGEEATTTAESDKRRRRTKMIVIPLVVILIIGVVLAVAIVVGNGSGGGTADSQENNDNINAFQPIPVPTTSPTYFGLYQCPYGKSGPTATKGCLGFIQCSSMGTAVGGIQLCSSGTLYDVKSGVCDFAENVSCSTNLPTQEEIVAASQQEVSTTATPPTSGVVGVVPPPPQNSPSITVGPIITSNLKLLFEGVANPGQISNSGMATIAKNLEDYLNIFYSPRVIGAYNDGDYIMESIRNVTITVFATEFGFVQNNNRRNNLRLRQLQTVAIKANGLAMIYQQTTKYNTIDSSITVGTIVRHPYQERYQERIVSYLKAVNPDTFSTLTRVLFVEGDIGGGQPAPQPAPVPVTNRPPPTPPPVPTTKAPITPPPTAATVPKTNPPTKAPITPPPTAATVPGTPQSFTIRGFIFLDENKNGIFDYEIEKPFQGVWANLRLCNTKDNENDWVNTAASEAQGMYTFENVEEGEYFIEFFKPPPGDAYVFSLQEGAGNDEFGSDVMEPTPNGGRTACFNVGPGFDSNKYFNAGYVLKATPAPTPAPSQSPTQSHTYCADITTTSAGIQNFNFLGCQIRCGNSLAECPGNTRCVFADVCIEPV